MCLQRSGLNGAPFHRLAFALNYMAGSLGKQLTLKAADLIFLASFLESNILLSMVVLSVDLKKHRPFMLCLIFFVGHGYTMIDNTGGRRLVGLFKNSNFQ